MGREDVRHIEAILVDEDTLQLVEVDFAKNEKGRFWKNLKDKSNKRFRNYQKRIANGKTKKKG